MRRLYLQIYFGVIATAVLVTIVAFAIGKAFDPERYSVPTLVDGVGQLIGEKIPPADAPSAELEDALRQIGAQLDIDATVWDAAGSVLAHVGPALPEPPVGDGRTAWMGRRHRARGGLTIQLGDGRRLGIALRPGPRHGPFGPGVLAIAGFLLLIGIGAYPVSRRITGRLERLRAAVENLGEGALDTRVPVEGRDEVAALAESFNRSAVRIQSLVESQRRMLASASHELRSPLTRLRLAIELMGGGNRPDLLPGAETDIEELDALIDDLLLATRLESAPAPLRLSLVDLFTLLKEEASRAGARASGPAATLRGDAGLLRRMLRNLFENAQRHGGGRGVEATLVELDSTAAARLRIRVQDRGPGVPANERARIFEPFYRPHDHSEGQDGGVGLGLALVREIARHHGGDARCLDREGGGTIFEVDLCDVAET